MSLCFLLICVLVVNYGQCAKILGVFPIAAPSHYILGSSLMKALAEKGHDVTVVSPFTEKDLPKNGSYKEIALTGFVEDFERRSKEINLFDMASANMFHMIFLPPFFANMMIELSEQALNHSNVQKLINSDEKFDVVIVEQFLNEAHKAFAAHFNSPLILLSTIGASSWINPLLGNPTPLSYITEPFLGFSSDMTFFQKCFNVFIHVFVQCFNHLFVFPQHDQLVKKYFSKNLHLNDVMYNISIALLNSHPSTNRPVPYVPNMIDIGGYHIKPPKKLPNDLQQYLDDAEEGVIYFSFGSHMKSSYMHKDKRDAIVNTFSKLKQKILWKWEEDVLPGKPPNVRLEKWLPQQGILAHPNVKLFITHCGLLSTTETIYHGVPVLAIPIGGDQTLNAEQVVQQGFGLKLNYVDISEATLLEEINELLTNPKYTENARRKSKLFHDRLVKPMDTATYWVEYVIRHKGAPHLRVAGVDLPWYKYLLVDVILAVAMFSIFALFLSYRLFKNMLAMCRKSNVPKIKIN